MKIISQDYLNIIMVNKKGKTEVIIKLIEYINIINPEKQLKYENKFKKTLSDIG